LNLKGIVELEWVSKNSKRPLRLHSCISYTALLVSGAGQNIIILGVEKSKNAITMRPAEPPSFNRNRDKRIFRPGPFAGG
jgi:hypothetical protein